MGDPVEIDIERNWSDQRSTYVVLRSRCAVAHEDGRWVILRHAEVVAAATDPGTFSSRVTARQAIPNTLDGDDHAAYRAVVDRYLTDERVAREASNAVGTRSPSSTPSLAASRSRPSPASGSRTPCALSPPGSAGHQTSKTGWSTGSVTTTPPPDRATERRLRRSPTGSTG